jgi:hypothetical protein
LIPQNVEYNKLITHRLEENWRSFTILFDLKHYGNCISIMCQELDQYIKILFLLKQTKQIRDQLIHNSINDQKWSIINSDNKKEYITDQKLNEFAGNLVGWEARVFQFGCVFKNISNNFNYMLKDPIKSLDDSERALIHEYIREYHDSSFSKDYTITELVPILPMILKEISDSIRKYSHLFNEM